MSEHDLSRRRLRGAWAARSSALQRLPRAPLAPGTVRVAIKAAGVNFPDVLMIQGLYQHRPELPFVPGLEAAGVVRRDRGAMWRASPSGRR